MSAINRYKEMLKEALRSNRPADYRQMRAAGTRDRIVRDEAEKADDLRQDLFHRMRVKKGTLPEDPFEAARALRTMASQADELAFATSF